MYKLCCDRCSKEIYPMKDMCTIEYEEGNYLGHKQILTESRHAKGTIHLCDDCNQLFQLFLNNEARFLN